MRRAGFYFGNPSIFEPGFTTAALYRGVVPFIALQLLMLGLLALLPGLATWLPGVLYG